MKIKPYHIIAIGASAGGMEEIHSFFDHTPSDGVAYVIIQHLSATFKSRMVELLARHSELVVKEGEHEMSVESNMVYLIPNDKFMTIRANRLHLTEKKTAKTPYLTINAFFISLAANSGANAVGVILSGLGSDGTEGIKAIKKAGGMVIARNPQTSEFNDMPSNAIATGMVDFILEPERMPGVIEDYIRNGMGNGSYEKSDKQNLTTILELIKDKIPVDFSDYKQATILRRTKRRASFHNFISLEQYIGYLNNTPEEAELLAKDFLISVTSFFRDEEAFKCINKEVLPGILKGIEPGEEVKIWIAGCATGEEVYSIGILILEQLTGKYKETVVKIFATDVDDAALMTARKGIYRQENLRNISPGLIGKYFVKEGDKFKVKPVLRKVVIFAQHDLVKNPPYCNMHLICCRNVLIYMTPVLQKKIFAMLLFGLRIDGYLFLGSSENPLPISQNLEVISKKWRIYKNIQAKRSARFEAFSLPESFDSDRSPIISRPGESFIKAVSGVDEAVNHLLVSDLDCLVICIDENNQVLKSYGDTTKYLFQKIFNLNIMELLPAPLAVAFNILRTKMLATSTKASVRGIKIKRGKKIVKVKLSVSPLPSKNDKQRQMLILSEDKSPAASKDEMVFDDTLYLNEYTSNLEFELKSLNEKLNSTVEQLNASSENMQSFNEELLSANEEMQSANEELQSVNEELDTINSDYQLKNRELLEINDDLNNYFRSNVNGQLFIDNNLLLMKFSPGTVKLINLLETDIGRPLSNISTNIRFETIIDDIKLVLENGTVITKEIEAQDGCWYNIMTMPYVQQTDDKRSGAILTFNDVTELKRTQFELSKKNQSLQQINSDLDNFVHAASHDLLSPLGNIQGCVEAINQIGVADPEINQLINIIDRSIRIFRTLIGDLATIAKIESEMLDVESVDLDELITNVEWSLESKIKSSGAVIRRNLQVNQVSFSKKNLRSILYNLISNAIKFKRDESPLVDISSLEESDRRLLMVQDNGIGIPKEGMEKIFDMYGRLQTDVEGRGIGLYLAKKMLNAGNGSLLVESELGIGSKFTLVFRKS